MSWIYLMLAGVFEIGWPIGLKLAQNAKFRIAGMAIAVVFMALSGLFLYIAQKSIPIGTSYAVWTGIGAVGTFLVGILFFGDPAGLLRYAGAGLIILGVVVLKLSH